MLSAFPCSDELEHDGFTQNTIVMISHGIAKGQMETCPPICVCTCCGQSIVEIDVARMMLKIALTTLDKQMPNSQFLLQQRNNNIWNPPKRI